METLQRNIPQIDVARFALQKSVAACITLAMFERVTRGRTTKPTLRSEKARPTRKMIDGECSPGVRQTELITNTLVIVVDKAIRMARTQIVIGVSCRPSSSIEDERMKTLQEKSDLAISRLSFSRGISIEILCLFAGRVWK